MTFSSRGLKGAVIMKAVVYHGKTNISVEDFPEPECGPQRVKVEVKWCGICGGDLRAYLFGPDSHHPANSILGHEFSGEVVEIGKGVEEFKVGDRVIPGIRAGLDEAEFWRHHEIGGAFAKYVVKHKDTLVKLDYRLSYEEGALIEPAVVAVHGLKSSGLTLGDTAFVAGAGPIGLLVLQASRAAGATKVFISDQFEARKKKARALGADEVLDFTQCDVPKEVHRLTDGKGVDIAFQCAQQALKDCVRSVRERGKVMVMAAHTEPVALDWRYDILYRWVSLIPSMGVTPEDLVCAMQFVADGRFRVADMVTGKIALDDFVGKGVETLVKGEQIKVMVAPE
jgi:(R,R)-butanediol dehydrogenase/meso-butanediol dehydrogenase/diacetyl reductase